MKTIGWSELILQSFMNIAYADFSEKRRTSRGIIVKKMRDSFFIHADTVICNINTDIRISVPINVDGDCSGGSFRFYTMEDCIFYNRL